MGLGTSNHPRQQMHQDHPRAETTPRWVQPHSGPIHSREEVTSAKQCFDDGRTNQISDHDAVGAITYHPSPVLTTRDLLAPAALSPWSRRPASWTPELLRGRRRHRRHALTGWKNSCASRRCTPFLCCWNLCHPFEREQSEQEKAAANEQGGGERGGQRPVSARDERMQLRENKRSSLAKPLASAFTRLFVISSAPLPRSRLQRIARETWGIVTHSPLRLANPSTRTRHARSAHPDTVEDRTCQNVI